MWTKGMVEANPYLAPAIVFADGPRVERVVRRLAWLVALLAVAWLVGRTHSHSGILEQVRLSISGYGYITMLIAVPAYWLMFCRFSVPPRSFLIAMIELCITVPVICFPVVVLLTFVLVGIGYQGAWRHVPYWPDAYAAFGISYACGCLALVLCDWQSSKQQPAAASPDRMVPVDKRKGLK